MAIDQFVGRLVRDQKFTTLSSISSLVLCRFVFGKDTLRIAFRCSQAVELLCCPRLTKDFQTEPINNVVLGVGMATGQTR